MARAGVERAGVERYAPDEIVVVLPQLQLVLLKLARLGATVEDTNVVTNRDLGLGKIRLETKQVKQVVDALDQMALPEPGLRFADKVARLAEARGGCDNVKGIDRILLGLRTLFERDYAGWELDAGKNREVERVISQPHVGGGGEGEPKLPSRSFEPFPARRAQPGRGVHVAVLDTKLVLNEWFKGGYAETPAALQIPKPTQWWKLGFDRPTYRPTQGHAALIVGRILRAAPAAQVDVYPVLDEDADGSTWEVAEQLASLARSDVQIVNLSLLCRTEDNRAPFVFRRAVERLSSPQFVIVAAAGNYGDERPVFPAAQPDVVAVGAVDADGNDAEWSNRGPWVDLTAPGVDIPTTYLTGRVRLRNTTRKYDGWALGSGTSITASIVSGALAAGTRPGFKAAAEVLRDLLDSGSRDNAGRPFVPRPDAPKRPRTC
jgi:hypothetical protein